MQVTDLKTNKTVNMEAKTVKELLNKLNINPTTVIVSRNDHLVTEEVKLKEEDDIKIIPIVSGG